MVERARVYWASAPEEVGIMIVWSKGLGKVTLPIELDKAEVEIEIGCLSLKGIIEPVWWQYSMMLSVEDLVEFLIILSSAKTSSFLVKGGGVFWWFTKRLIRFVPRLLWGITRERVANLFRR